jgi:hypothetical protein
MDKYKNKYRILSARAQWWDYGWDGSYFITICTSERKHLFGKIIDDQMIFSGLGKIADECWQKITEHAANVELSVHVVMPNHMHGILNLHNHADPFKSVPPEFNDVGDSTGGRVCTDNRAYAIAKAGQKHAVNDYRRIQIRRIEGGRKSRVAV